MPEGDTIHRAANRLRPALVDQELKRFTAPRLVGDRPRIGERIESVEAAGKHLLIAFSGGLTVETHLKMTGSWHLYRETDRWRKPAAMARLVVGVEGWDAVCFNAPVVRTAPSGRAGRQDLGPDLCTPDVDIDRAVARARHVSEPTAEVADVLLDQRAASGIGNVYKSEVLWALQVDPFCAIGEIDDATLTALYGRANRLLLANLKTTTRTTVPGGLAVYDRRGRPCRRCGTRISSRAQGPHARTTYWCPRCQTAGPR